jgi:hypothetical protein
MQSRDAEIKFDIHLLPGEALSLPGEVTAAVGPGHWLVSIRPAEEESSSAPIRDHSGLLNSYVPEDEGLYDDYPTG